MSLSELGPEAQRWESEVSPGGRFLPLGWLCRQAAMASAVSFWEHHVPVTFCHWQVQCYCPSSGLRHLGSTLVQKSTRSAVPMRHRSPRSLHCDLKILRCVKLSLVSLVQWILNSPLHSSSTSPAKRPSACLPACTSICFPISPAWNKSGTLSGALESTRYEETGNSTQISCFLNEYTWLRLQFSQNSRISYTVKSRSQPRTLQLQRLSGFNVSPLGHLHTMPCSALLAL